MLKQARSVEFLKSTGGLFQKYQALLRIPILLLMTCYIYEEYQCLPAKRTDILRNIYTLLMQRSATKISKRTTNEDYTYDTLSKLGKLAWDALKRDELFLKEV